MRTTSELRPWVDVADRVGQIHAQIMGPTMERVVISFQVRAAGTRAAGTCGGA